MTKMLEWLKWRPKKVIAPGFCFRMCRSIVIWSSTYLIFYKIYHWCSLILPFSVPECCFATALELVIIFDYFFLPFLPQGISYDHVELNYFLNGKSLQCPVTGIRGTVYPVFYGEGHLTELG